MAPPLSAGINLFAQNPAINRNTGQRENGYVFPPLPLIFPTISFLLANGAKAKLWWVPALRCRACGEINDGDYRYCKRCAAPKLHPVEQTGQEITRAPATIDVESLDDRIDNLFNTSSAYEKQKEALQAGDRDSTNCGRKAEVQVQDSGTRG
ncbi:hypothetical protein Bbelb_281740 [Branchiostoma belcheri]|nr:hypothetical protein Bbelb_281740 [Branchiostoma belcheri]